MQKVGENSSKKTLFWKYFKMSLQYFEEKKYFYQNVFLSQFFVQNCAILLLPSSGLQNKFLVKDWKKV